ncbi:hypothetical protein V8C43DRAFT_270829 [Trichoderma afarasin]
MRGNTPGFCFFFFFFLFIFKFFWCPVATFSVLLTLQVGGLGLHLMKKNWHARIYYFMYTYFPCTQGAFISMPPIAHTSCTIYHILSLYE